MFLVLKSHFSSLEMLLVTSNKKETNQLHKIVATKVKNLLLLLEYAMMLCCPQMNVATFKCLHTYNGYLATFKIYYLS